MVAAKPSQNSSRSARQLGSGTPRIMLFVETAGPGGAESVVLSLARAYHERGVAVIVLTLSEDYLTSGLTNANVPWTRIESRRRFDFLLPFRIARQIRQHQIELLHSHLLDSNFYGSLAARLTRIPHLASEHGDVHHPQRKLFLKFKLQVASALGTYFAAVSDYTLNRLRHFGVNRSRLLQLPNPVPPPIHLTPEARENARLVLRPQGSADEFIWIHVANLRPVKDQRTLLRGFAKSLQLTDRPQALALVGDGGERQQLEELVEELGIRRHVTFCGFRADAKELLQAANGFILSSRSEALPVSLLEAGASGLFVISSKVGGIPEIIDDGRSGFLFRAGDSDMLAQKIRDALNQPQIADALAAQFRSFVERHFLLERVVDEHLDLYRRLIG